MGNPILRNSHAANDNGAPQKPGDSLQGRRKGSLDILVGLHALQLAVSEALVHELAGEDDTADAAARIRRQADEILDRPETIAVPGFKLQHVAALRASVNHQLDMIESRASRLKAESK